METQLQIGDIVRLKSGGPKMTTEKIEGDTAGCFWFKEDGERREGTFNLKSLKFVPEERERIDFSSLN